MKEENAPFMISVHCMNRHTNFEIQTFYKMGIGEKLKTLCYKVCMHISLTV